MRTVGPERAEALATVHAAAFEAPWSAAEFAALLAAPGVVALEAEGGFALVRALAGEAEMLTLAVAPELRRRGTGRTLLRAAMAAAGEAGAESLVLEAAADNAPALALYAQEGFTAVGRRRAYYARTGEPAADALVLRCVLPRPAP